jgi:hypothetical protein
LQLLASSQHPLTSGFVLFRSTIAFVINLHEHHNVTLSQAYQLATSQFIRLRAISEIANFAAEEEALAYGENARRTGSSRQAFVSFFNLSGVDDFAWLVVDLPFPRFQNRIDFSTLRLVPYEPTISRPPRHPLRRQNRPPPPYLLDFSSVPIFPNVDRGVLS